MFNDFKKILFKNIKILVKDKKLSKTFYLK